nr:YdcF family protein [Porphyrobacter sp. GA68]
MARVLAALILFYTIGFLWFAAVLPQPAGPERTDAVIVPTGGAGRIERGLEMLQAGQAREVFISGVARQVRPEEFAAQFGISPADMECCVTLGYAAVDTRSNAKEAAQWVAERGYRSARLVTTDWHMRRTLSEFGAVVPGDFRIVADAVPSNPPLGVLFAEYNKYLASVVWRALPL